MRIHNENTQKNISGNLIQKLVFLVVSLYGKEWEVVYDPYKDANYL